MTTERKNSKEEWRKERLFSLARCVHLRVFYISITFCGFNNAFLCNFQFNGGKGIWQSTVCMQNVCASKRMSLCVCVCFAVCWNAKKNEMKERKRTAMKIARHLICINHQEYAEDNGEKSQCSCWFVLLPILYLFVYVFVRTFGARIRVHISSPPLAPLARSQFSSTFRKDSFIFCFLFHESCDKLLTILLVWLLFYFSSIIWYRQFS